MDALLYAVIEIARIAGQKSRHAFGAPNIPTTRKEDASLLTPTDVEIHTYVSTALSKLLPSSLILSEEGSHTTSQTKPYWIIDPIDGTANFAHHIPFFAISIALQENGVTKLGVVYAPIQDVLFATTSGETDILIQGDPTKILPKESTPTILLDTGSKPETIQLHRALHEKLELAEYSTTPLDCASLELCLVAAGLYSGFIHRGLEVWDIAAGVLLSETAGRITTDFTGTQKNIFTPGILSAKKDLHGGLLHIIMDVKKSETL